MLGSRSPLALLSTAVLLAACAAAPGATSEVAESAAVATPTEEPTPSPTASPTPVSLDHDSACGEWEMAESSERLSWAQSALLALPGARHDASASDLKIAIGVQCVEMPTAGLAFATEMAVGGDPRFLAPTPSPTPEPTPVVYTELSPRDWQLLVKAPDDYTGNGYLLWGCITQFDAATGESSFRAQGAAMNTEYWFSDGANTMFNGDAEALAQFVADDVISMKVISEGSYSYDTQAGGNTTVPMFRVTEITLQGSCGA